MMSQSYIVIAQISIRELNWIQLALKIITEEYNDNKMLYHHWISWIKITQIWLNMNNLYAVVAREIMTFCILMHLLHTSFVNRVRDANLFISYLMCLSFIFIFSDFILLIVVGVCAFLSNLLFLPDYAYHVFQ